MMNVELNVRNANAVRRLSVKYGLNYDAAIDQFLSNLPRSTTLDGFNFTLKNFQADGVAWMESKQGTGILADEQGCGKTVVAMAYAHKNHMFPMLVVVPNTLKYNWRNEILAMTGERYRVNVVGKAYSKKETAKRTARHANVIYSKVPTAGCDIYIINYDILAANVENIEALNVKFMAVDESHKIKNQDARRTQAMIRLATGEYDEKLRGGKRRTLNTGRKIDAVTLMSGTPLVNRPREMYTSVRTVASYVPQFSSFTKFAFRYCGAQQNRWGWDFTGATNTNELNTLLTQHCMLRRLKADVLKELPPKVYRTIPLDFDRAEYDSVEKAFSGVNWQGGMQAIIRLGGNVPKSDAAIVAIQKLREIAGYAKLTSTVEWIRDYTEEGEKLVVFAHNRQVIETIKAQLEQDTEYQGAVAVIYGGIADEERANAVLRFQNDARVRVILVGITAGGFGLTLTAARAVAFVQLPWTPGEISQCVDRIHRIGQDADSVTVFNLVAEGTIEEDMAEILIAKGQVLDAVLDAGRVVNALDLKIEGK